MRILLAHLNIAAMLLAATASAEVFQNLPANAAASARSAKNAYSGSMKINGGHAHVSVLSFETSLPSVMKGIQSDHANRQGALFMTGERMAVAAVQQNNRVIRFLAVTPASPMHTLLFRIEQSVSDYERSKQPLARSLLTKLPPIPGARPTFHMEDKNTSMAIEVSSSTMYPADIHRHASQSLIDQGWTPLTPLERMRTTPGLMIYLRQKELAMVSASIDSRTRQSTITMLHKRPALR